MKEAKAERQYHMEKLTWWLRWPQCKKKVSSGVHLDKLCAYL